MIIICSQEPLKMLKFTHLHPKNHTSICTRVLNKHRQKYSSNSQRTCSSRNKP